MSCHCKVNHCLGLFKIALEKIRFCCSRSKNIDNQGNCIGDNPKGIANHKTRSKSDFSVKDRLQGFIETVNLNKRIIVGRRDYKI